MIENEIRKDLKNFTLSELTEEFQALGEKKFRAKQVYEWIHQKLVDDVDAMTNLSGAFREQLKNGYTMTHLEIEDLQISKEDGTRKYLFRLADGNYVESVLMRYKYGNSVCISSQVGCRMGCKFCASTLDGLARNLASAEMLDQIYQITKDTGERVSHVVVMGTGEPMDNYDNLLKFIHMLTDEDGLHLSQRDVTVSTCGIVPRMRQLADEKLQITLALSLHAPTDEKRKALMPIANSYSLEELMDACRYYFKQTGRRLTFEYSLVKGKNDGKEEAAELIRLIKGMNCHVNLIPVNPVKECGMEETDRGDVISFRKELEKAHIQATIRREMGRDIDGACGQLRRRHSQNSDSRGTLK
ncbi:MAG: 23S rRNA (adenine(2503)-C(2))-methyltransferase RlmN [Lachnospiraceae bacterium]|nr:23S rRNA (adenine(2503)-C(2))-methyltransferase RlmN [Lachnospiraceae bacterium]